MHRSRCAHVPCYCHECTPPFEGSPESLVHHLTAPSGIHSWPAVNIKYETCYLFIVPESLEDHRRLLVAQEDDIVFLLAVGTGKARVGRRQSLSCVLTVSAPPAYEGDLGASLMLNGTVASCSVPGNVDMEDDWFDTFVHPNVMHGDSNEYGIFHA
ncbi:uncharacterized protein [Aegilops tauschii subsp. strangulata]|uniref:uncharacterized protein n=1 Tax=Aegilops tauschii subsp. strangulata TaxID=200361 RepID=UPI00098B77FE|nr:uncharacterized protein LOC109761073 [Aegilops tauschii subsp. strangulata]